MFNVIQHEKNLVKSNISKMYENSSEKLEKAEGSRGGKVIGHTKSGKPVYADHSADHKVYENFSSQDHQDAGTIHNKQTYKFVDAGTGNSHEQKPEDIEDKEKIKHHSKIRESHFDESRRISDRTGE